MGTHQKKKRRRNFPEMVRVVMRRDARAKPLRGAEREGVPAADPCKNLKEEGGEEEPSFSYSRDKGGKRSQGVKKASLSPNKFTVLPSVDKQAYYERGEKGKMASSIRRKGEVSTSN